LDFRFLENSVGKFNGIYIEITNGFFLIVHL